MSQKQKSHQNLALAAIILFVLIITGGFWGIYATAPTAISASIPTASTQDSPKVTTPSAATPAPLAVLSPPTKPEPTESIDANLAQQKLQTPIHEPKPDALPKTPPHHNPRIAIIIDDMGLDLRRSQRAVSLPAPVTLSYLGYADHLQSQVDRAAAAGHEIMLHIPMEAIDPSLDPGPNALRVHLSPDDFQQRLRDNLQSFTGYRGINNHMGSRTTSDPDKMMLLMQTLAHKDVYFVDSWTSPHSVAYQKAAKFDIPRARRDIFLDHYDGEAAVWRALAKAEQLAKRQGQAIVIGHPKDATLRVLAAWLPQASAKNLTIVPVSKLVYRGQLAYDPVLGQSKMAHQNPAAKILKAGRGHTPDPHQVTHIAPAAGNN